VTTDGLLIYLEQKVGALGDDGTLKVGQENLLLALLTQVQQKRPG
jgi:hypothetical protein